MSDKQFDKTQRRCHGGVMALRQAPLAAAMASMLAMGAAEAAVKIPTEAPQPSLTAAQFRDYSFNQRVLLFEEFGTQKYDPSSSDDSRKLLPPPVDPDSKLTDCQGNPAALGKDLDKVIKADHLGPVPTEYSEQGDDVNYAEAQNPWYEQIKTCNQGNGMISEMTNMPADGRPSGEDFAHQRWSEKNLVTQAMEFQPKVFFQTIMAGARNNGGARDELQSHGYGSKTTGKFSEFAPGGLYYNTLTSPYAPGGPGLPNDPGASVDGTYLAQFEGTTEGIPVVD